MTFAFPAPKTRKMKGRLLSAAQEPENNGGGVDQRFLALGSRFAFDVVCPPMAYDTARVVVAALLRAEREEVVMDLIQPGLTIGNPGPRTVGGFTSSNATLLSVAGGAAYPAGVFQFFNLQAPDGRLYLHAVVQSGGIPGVVRVAPALRTDFNAGAPVDFATPKIQGWIGKGGRETPWDVDEAHHYGVSFTITESGR